MDERKQFVFCRIDQRAQIGGLLPLLFAAIIGGHPEILTSLHRIFDVSCEVEDLIVWRKGWMAHRV